MPPVSGVQHPASSTWSNPAPLHEAPELRAAATSESDSASPELTILVPCLDEEDNVHITLDHIGRVLREHDIDEHVPVPPDGLTPYREAVRLALGKMSRGDVETTWAGASSGVPADPLPSDPAWAGLTVYTDERERTARHVDPADAWRVVEGVGGANGWYSLPVAWAVRGLVHCAPSSHEGDGR